MSTKEFQKLTDEYVNWSQIFCNLRIQFFNVLFVGNITFVTKHFTSVLQFQLADKLVVQVLQL